MEYFSLIIAVIALAISFSTFWLTKIKRGVVKMTRPTIICFIPANGGDNPKVFIRTLLYSTSEKGQYIQNMYVRLQRGESIQNFNIWAYQDKDLVRGSGLFINKNGIALSHHFLLPKDQNNYQFLAGDYTLQVFAETVNKKPINIFEQKLTLTDAQQIAMNDNRAIYFDWAPNTQNYFSYIDKDSHKSNEALELMKLITGTQSK